MRVFVLCVLCVLCAGCVTVRVEKTAPDGTKITAKYDRYLLPQKLEGVLINLETGEAMIEKSQSETERLVGAAVEGALRAVQPLK